jgi:hypothetical protein
MFMSSDSARNPLIILTFAVNIRHEDVHPEKMLHWSWPIK